MSDLVQVKNRLPVQRKLDRANTYGRLLMSQKSDPILLRQRLGQNNLIRTFRQAKYSKGLFLPTSILMLAGLCHVTVSLY